MQTREIDRGEMMKLVLRPLAAALAFVCCAGFGVPSQRIEYTLTPVMQDGALAAVQIDLRFRGQGDGETNLRLPDAWGGEQELWRVIEGLAVVSGAQMRDGERASQRVLTHAPNASIHLRYRVIQDWQGPPPAGRNTYRPIIQPTYFHLIGEAALVTPDLHLATPVRVRARNLPRGWSFASDLQHPGLALGHVFASVTVAGGYRIRWAADRNIRVAIRGEWSFADQHFTEQVGEIVSGHRRFWRDRSSPYLVTMTQTVASDPGRISIGGTGLDDAFAFFATANADNERLVRTLAHESLHTWIPGRVGGMPTEAEARDYWFSEGFTDFYTGRMLVREGLWSPQQFAQDLNEMLEAYAQSPVREAPNARIAADFWNDGQVQQLPYQRGRLLATIWDARLRAQGRSLDAAMLEMRERALAGDPLKAAEMFPLVLESMGVDVRAEIDAHAEAGGAILLAEDVFAPCGRVVTREVAVFERGFDVAALQASDGVFSGVDPESPAYAAGLRDGMVFVRRESGRIGDSEQPLTYVVRDGEQERTVSYYPRGSDTYMRQRLDLDEPLEGERYAQCRAVLGGA
jgi:predicted metalloprotease with PDZ domain